MGNTSIYLDVVLDLQLILMFCYYYWIVLSLDGLLVDSERLSSEVRRLVTVVSGAELLLLVVVVEMVV